MWALTPAPLKGWRGYIWVKAHKILSSTEKQASPNQRRSNLSMQARCLQVKTSVDYLSMQAACLQVDISRLAVYAGWLLTSQDIGRLSVDLCQKSVPFALSAVSCESFFPPPCQAPNCSLSQTTSVTSPTTLHSQQLYSFTAKINR
jgi:hypothetical protein